MRCPRPLIPIALLIALATGLPAADAEEPCSDSPVDLRDALPFAVVHLPVDDPDLRRDLAAALEASRRGAPLPVDAEGRPALHRERQLALWQAANPEPAAQDALRGLEAALAEIPLPEAVLEAKSAAARATALARLLRERAAVTGVKHYEERGFLRVTLALHEGQSVRDYFEHLARLTAGGVWFDPATGTLVFCGTGRFVVF
jgi:hypothetical protein